MKKAVFQVEEKNGKLFITQWIDGKGGKGAVFPIKENSNDHFCYCAICGRDMF